MNDVLFAPACPQCHAEHPTVLGQLGRRVHFRCRDCGFDYSRTEPQETN